MHCVEARRGRCSEATGTWHVAQWYLWSSVLMILLHRLVRCLLYTLNFLRSQASRLRTFSVSRASNPFGSGVQWDSLKPPGQYRDGPSNSFLAPPPQEEKDPSFTGLEQQPHSGSWRWEANTCLSLGLISVGCTSWCLAMADSASHAHGRWPLSMGCQSVGLLWYGNCFWYMGRLASNDF